MNRTDTPLRVLVYAPHEPWPLDGGGRIQLYHVLDQLARRAAVTLVLPQTPRFHEHLPPTIAVETTAFDPSGNKPAPHPQDHPGLVSQLAQRHFGRRDDVATWLRRHAHAGRFDVVLLNGAIAGQYAGCCRVPVVWNPLDELVLPTLRGVESGAWSARWRALRHALLYALYERQVARQAAATVFVSSVDAAYARRWAGPVRLEVVQNGVDLDYFSPTDETPRAGTVVFVGALEFPPNIDGITRFMHQVWPHVYRRGRRLLIVGRRPVPAVQALATEPGVELHADVPDVRPYLRQAAAVIVPIRQGAGLKNKILEGCAMRRPVVATQRALGGLSARRHIDVIPADRPENWVAALERLLERPTYAAEIAQNGYDWVRRTHTWANAGARFHDILASVARPAPRAPEPAYAPAPEPPASLSAQPRPPRTGELVRAVPEPETVCR